MKATVSPRRAIRSISLWPQRKFRSRMVQPWPSRDRAARRSAMRPNSCDSDMGEGSLLAWGTDMAVSDNFSGGGMGRVLYSTEEARTALRSAKRLAVLGIKPETHAGQAAHYVPAFMQRQGCEIVPVPVYYPEVTEILGEPVYRKLVDVPGDVDMVIVFRRSRDVLPHV